MSEEESELEKLKAAQRSAPRPDQNDDVNAGSGASAKIITLHSPKPEGSPASGNAPDLIERLRTFIERIKVDETFKVFNADSIELGCELYLMKEKSPKAKIAAQSIIEDLKNIFKKTNRDFKDWEKTIETTIKAGKKAYNSEAAPIWTIDTVPDGNWIYTNDRGKPISNSVNCITAIRRSGVNIRYDEWKQKLFLDGKYLEEDELAHLLTFKISDMFGFIPKKDDIQDAIVYVIQDNKFNSRLDELNAIPDPGPSYDWISMLIKILDCKDTEYNREVARMLPVGVVQRSFYPGCRLQRMITLQGRQGTRKSSFVQILAGNTEFKNGILEENNFTRANIYVMSEVTRATALRGKAVHEFDEKAGLRKMELEHFKSDITRTVDFYRPLFKSEAVEVARRYDSISTTNKDTYNYDDENRRDYGIEVGNIDTDLFIQEYNNIMGCVVREVKNGMSGGPRSEIWELARYEQEKRIVSNDLSVPLDRMIALAGIDEYQQRFFGLRRLDKSKMGLGIRFQISNDNALLYVNKYIDFHKLRRIQATKHNIAELLVRTEVLGIKWCKSANPMAIPKVKNGTERGFYIDIPFDKEEDLNDHINDIKNGDLFFDSISSIIDKGRKM
jgi:hypothetical protein